jgi:phage terminase large subunit
VNIASQFVAEPITPLPEIILSESSALEAIRESIALRFEHLLEVERGGPDAIKFELAICAQDVFHWFRWYAWTYDPRNPLEEPPLPANLPFDLFPRQKELVNWIFYISSLREDGCLKKSRDIGFTWLAGALAWHRWRFVNGFKTTFGSRKSEYVDRIGDPDSIFEKIRLLYKALPKWMMPVGFDPYTHDNHMLIVNPQNGNTIRGEGGEEMGRGGRSTWYFIDEAAKIEHADRVDAATSANSEVRIWGSSINPQNENNLFQRKYTSFPPDRVFRFHYSDDPRKTAAWAEKKQRSVTPETWAAEYEIDDSYTVEDICIPASWVEAAKKLPKLLEAKIAALTASYQLELLKTHEAHQPALKARLDDEVKKFRFEPRAEGIAGGDVGGGKAQSVVIARFGAVVAKPRAWGDPDTNDTAFKMLDYCQELRLPKRADNWEPRIKVLRFDSVAIGQGVSATMKRNPRPGLIVTGVNTGAAPTDTRWPDGEEATEKFFNLKAEAWWTARERFKRTYEMVLWLEDKPGGQRHPVDELIALPDEPNDQHMQRLVAQLSQVKWNRTDKGKVQIEPKASLARRGIASPDYADALILTFAGASKAEKWAAFAKVVV